MKHTNSKSKGLNLKSGNKITYKKIGSKTKMVLGSKNQGTSKLDGTTK